MSCTLGTLEIERLIRVVWADVEYSRTGAVVKGQERAKAKSKYDEDGKWIISFGLRRLKLTLSFFSLPKQSYRRLGILV